MLWSLAGCSGLCMGAQLAWLKQLTLSFIAFLFWFGFLPNEGKGERHLRAALLREPTALGGPAPGQGNGRAVTGQGDHASGRPISCCSVRAGSDWMEPSPSALRFLISSVRIGKKKKIFKARFNFAAFSAWRLEETLARIWRAGKCI